MSYKSEKQLEEQMILRLPPQLADQVRKMLRTKQLSDEIEFEFENGIVLNCIVMFKLCSHDFSLKY